jgi:hypothetical protein
VLAAGRSATTRERTLLSLAWASGHARRRRPRSRSGRAAALSWRGPGQLHLPGGAEVRTSPRPSVSLTSYEQPDCPRSLSACKHPNPDAVRKRSQAQRLGAGDAHSGSRRPGRRVAPSSKGIVTSAATARALCHGTTCLAVAGGRLLHPGDAQVDPLEASRIRALSLLHASAYPSGPGRSSGLGHPHDRFAKSNRRHCEPPATPLPRFR